jgi:hypothetical protein
VKSYWDTSAAINALVSPEVWARLSTGEHFARLHLFSEFFATMTGRGIPVKDETGNPARLVLSPKDAAAWLRVFRSKVNLVELDDTETLDALDNAQAHNIQGGKVYDYVHAMAAQKAQSDALLTRNTDDFSDLTKISLHWP